MKKLFCSAILALSISLTASASPIIFGGWEDTPKGGDLDFQDLVFSITNATLIQSGGIFTDLTPALPLTYTGTPFWNNVSFDGPNMNVGDYWEGEGGFSGGPVAPNLQYLATPSGGIVSNVEFSGGSTVTITGGISADTDTLLVCYVFDCAGTEQPVNGLLTWTPVFDWELVGVADGFVQSYSDAGYGEISTFAFAVPGTDCPEPSTAWLAVSGLGLVLFARARRNISVRE